MGVCISPESTAALRHLPDTARAAWPPREGGPAQGSLQCAGAAWGGARMAASGSSPGPTTGLSRHHRKPELLKSGPQEPNTGPEVRNGVWRVGSQGRRRGGGLIARFPQQAHSSGPAPVQRTEPRPPGLAGWDGVSTYNQRRHAGTHSQAAGARLQERLPRGWTRAGCGAECREGDTVAFRRCHPV